MIEQNPHAPHLSGPDLLRQLLQIENTKLKDTWGRYALATTHDSFDVSQVVEGTPEKRYLIVPAETTVGEIEAQLEETGIFTLSPAALAGNYVVYEVPVGAKPLVQERLFPDRTSTETYISDEELFATLGKLWGNIYRSTGQLPRDAPLKNTGMLLFVGKNARLFPIPPYKWTPISQPEAAKKHFLETISQELITPNSADQDYERLLDAASQSWEES